MFQYKGPRPLRSLANEGKFDPVIEPIGPQVAIFNLIDFKSTIFREDHLQSLACLFC